MLVPFNNKLNLNPFFAPETPIVNTGSGVLTKDAINDFLKDDKIDEKEIIDLEDSDDKDDKKDKKDTKTKDKSDDDKSDNDNDKDGEDEESEDDEKLDDLDELEDELDEPDDEKLELVTPVRRSEILKKYPKLFKDFPYLEKAYYREQQYTEILPTIDDAKAAVEKSEILDNFENDLTNGNIKNILQATKNSDPKALYKIADNYLSALAGVDEKAYHHVIGNLTRHTIIAMAREGKASKNESLEIAAQILNQFVFGSSEFKNPSNLVDDKFDDNNDNEKEEVNRERTQFLQERFETSRDELNIRVGNSLSSTIESYIDPKDSMTPYVKKNAAREALETLTDTISKDTRFKTILDKLWENAHQNKYNKESLDRIRSAYLSRAKSLLPSVIKKARNEALKGMGKRVRDDDSNDNDNNEKIISDRKGPIQRRTTSSNNSGSKIKSIKDIPAGMRSIDFLMADD